MRSEALPFCVSGAICMRKYKISGVPITQKDGRLVGILTNRDLRFETRFDIPIRNVMTKDHLITVPVGTTLEDAEKILHEHRVEKLLVVDDKYNLKGLITVKDIQKKLKYPNAAKDSQGRLRVGAALGATGDFLERAQELAKAKVDVVAIDSAHALGFLFFTQLQTVANDFGFAVFPVLSGSEVTLFDRALVAETLGALQE